MSFFFTNLSLCPTTLIDFTADLIVNLISKLMYENLKYIYFVTTELRKKTTRISIKDKMYTFIKENYDIKELGKSFTYLKNEKMTYIRNFETSTAKSSMNENPLFNSSHREHIKLPLGIMCCFKTEQ